MTWSLSLLLVLAFVVCFAGRSNPVVCALAATCLVVLDAPAADFLNSPLIGSPLPKLTGGLWRYNTVGYGFVFLALTGLPQLVRCRDVPTRLLQAFGVVVALGLLWSPDPALGLQVLLDVLAVFGLVAVFGSIAHDDESWYWVGLVGGSLAAGCGLLYFVNRHSIPFTNPNAFVFAPLTGLFAVCVAFARGATTARRELVLGGLAVINGLWAFLSTSRGGFLAAGVCMAFLLFEVRDVRKRAVLVVGAALLVVAVTSAFSELGQQAAGRIAILFDSSARMRARTSGRSDLVVGAWEIFTRHPFGVGTGGFEATWATLGSVGGQRAFMHVGERFPAHAGWMKVLAEDGFVGFAVLASLTLSFALVPWRRGDRRLRNLGVLTALAFGVSLAANEFHLKGLFFLPAAVVVCLGAAPGHAWLSRRARTRRPLRLVRPRQSGVR
jgi:hypothetical protein